MSKKTTTALTVGRTYYGPNEARLTVFEVRPKEVVVQLPISLRFETRTHAEMQEFIAGSTRRTYVRQLSRSKREVRTKIEEDDDTVTYTADGKRKTVKRTAWDKWRAKVPA